MRSTAPQKFQRAPSLPAARDGIHCAADSSGGAGRPARLSHGLSRHPLLSLERLAGLATVLAPSQMEWNRGRLGITDDPRKAAPNGLTALETVLGIETCDSWIAFRNVGLVQEFAPIVEAIQLEMQSELRQRGIKMIQPRCDLYLSSPHAVTPCHIDHQDSFLLQIQGSKKVSVFDRDDREVMPQRDLELLTARRQRSFKMNRRFADRGQLHPLAMGSGLYLPARAPHYVRNGEAVSISASLTFGTKRTNAERAVLCMNHRLRRVGLSPRTPGASRASDTLKVATFRGLGGTHRVIRRR